MCLLPSFFAQASAEMTNSLHAPGLSQAPRGIGAVGAMNGFVDSLLTLICLVVFFCVRAIHGFMQGIHEDTQGVYGAYTGTQGVDDDRMIGIPRGHGNQCVCEGCVAA